jgi:hypothetical protein
MQKIPPRKNTPQQAIILDLSLFIIDLLDKNKIQQNVTTRGDLLEVPSALVEMLRDSRVGSPVLFLFVYSLLIKTITKYREKQINDPRIAHLINSSDQVVRGEAWEITKQLYDEFSSLIDIVPNNTSSENLSGTENVRLDKDPIYPIRRYDSIGSLSREDQKHLQEIYTSELGLPEHPLYDQYFSQIYHAQTVGGIGESHLLRKAISLDEETFNVVAKWKGGIKHLEEESQDVKDSRNILEWFISTYIKDERRDLVFDFAYDTSKGLLELSVAGALTAAAIGPLVGISLVTLAGGTILRSIAIAPPEVIDPRHKPAYFIVATFFVLACLVVLAIVFSKSISDPQRALPTPISSPLPTQITILLSPSPTPAATLIVPTAIPATATFLPINPIAIINSPNYCLYVVQPNDTLQSVATWFFISENDIRNNDRLVNWGAFSVHQLINVPAACCAHINNNGFTHSVQPHDNVFRLAINFSTSAEKIAAANNLFDLRYIQSGQNLCIPYP